MDFVAFEVCPVELAQPTEIGSCRGGERQLAALNSSAVIGMHRPNLQLTGATFWSVYSNIALSTHKYSPPSRLEPKPKVGCSR